MNSAGFETACKDAVTYVKAKLPLGAANRPRSSPRTWPQAVAALGALRDHQGTRFRDGPYDVGWLRAIAIGAETAEAGNCGEQSAVALVHLLNRGVRPLDYMVRTDGDHAFVLVGRKNGSDSTSPSTWGGAAFVCDPWHGTVFAGTIVELSKRGWHVKSSIRID